MRRSAPTERLYIFLLFVFLITPSPLFAQDLVQDNPSLRVRLLRDISPRTLVISSDKTADLYSGDLTNPIAQLRSREKLTLTTSNNQVYLRLAEDGIYARSLIIDQDPTAELTIEIVEARGNIAPRKYKGAFMIQVDPSTPSTLSIVNEVGMEDYVAGVLASEFNFKALEASKAVAVSIRTLAYRALENQHGPDFTIPDNEIWQVYGGTLPITRTVREAVAQTEGEVLRYNGELIEATYFASSGGHTANHEDVWNASEILPYLRGKEDPYDFNSPHHTWESTISREQLLRLLSNKFRFKVNGIRILQQSRDGRVNTLALTGDNNQQERISGNEFRLMVTNQFGRESLKSTMFDINVQPGLYIFSGKGFGHGVGLNQWGALQLSKKGNLYEEILSFYYTDVFLDNGGVFEGLITDSQQFIDDAAAFIFDEGEPEAVEFPVINNTLNTASSSGASDVSSLLFGDEDDERPAAQNNNGTNRRNTNNGNADRSAAKAKTVTAKLTPRPKGKRIGW